MRLFKIIVFGMSVYGINGIVTGRYNLLNWIFFREDFFAGMTAFSAYILLFSIVGELFWVKYVGRHIGAGIGVLIAFILMLCRCF